MSDEPVDPMKEAIKQYYRDNPDRALYAEVFALKVTAGLVVLCVVLALIVELFK